MAVPDQQAMKAVVFGATGAVGSQIYSQLVSGSPWTNVVTIGRRAPPDAAAGPGRSTRHLLLPDLMALPSSAEAADAMAGADAAFIALGTTRGVRLAPLCTAATESRAPCSACPPPPSPGQGGGSRVRSKLGLRPACKQGRTPLQTTPRTRAVPTPSGAWTWTSWQRQRRPPRRRGCGTWGSCPHRAPTPTSGRAAGSRCTRCSTRRPRGRCAGGTGRLFWTVGACA